MEIFLKALNWYPDEADTDVLADFTIRRSAIGSGNGGNIGEASDYRFRICQDDIMPAAGIRMYPTTQIDPKTQRVVSDVHALVIVPRDTWTQLIDSKEQTRFVDYLALVVGRMYLFSQQSNSDGDTLNDAS